MKQALSDILPVIVLYRIPLQEAAAYRTLLATGLFARYMVYDNSPRDYEQQPMPAEAVYVRDIFNGGLSKAYNTAADYALTEGYTRILLLDQDTVFPPEAAAAYAAAPRACALWAPAVRTLKGAAFSPVRTALTGKKAVVLPPGNHSLHDCMAVNSGMCIALTAFRRAGGYNDNVRLDFADFQFQERLRRLDDRWQLLPFVAVQDFSNDERDQSRLYRRFRLYLQSARGCRFAGRKARLRHHLEVLRHTLSLTLRTKSPAFLKYFIQSYIFNK